VVRKSWSEIFEVCDSVVRKARALHTTSYLQVSISASQLFC
jgi:hypothetical protein